MDHAPTILESQIAAASRVNMSYRPKGCTGFVSLITMMTRCCCTRPSGKTEVPYVGDSVDVRSGQAEMADDLEAPVVRRQVERSSAGL